MLHFSLYSIIYGLFVLASGAEAGTNPPPQDLLRTYESIQKALAGDEVETAKQLAGKAQEALKGASSKTLTKMEEGLKALTLSQSDPESRKAFGVYSEGATALVRENEKLKTQWQLFYCPMVAKGTYRYWIQAKGTDLKNPYYGAKMLTCGVSRPW